MKIDIGGANGRHESANALNDQRRVHIAMQGGLRRPGLATDWNATSSAARVVISRDGRPIRNPITGRRAQPTGIYVARKPGRALAHESMNEHAFLQHSEVDTSVVDYLSQPCRFEFVMGGVKRTYIPDCARLLASGRIEIVEVKRDGQWVRDLDYAAKLRHVDAICASVGWTFRVVHGAPLRERTVRNANVRLIQQDRFARFASRDVFVVQELLASGSALPLGRVLEVLADPIVGRAQLCAMMVARQVEIELGQPLSRNSRVQSLDAHRAPAGEAVA